jgi:hypothetical protein
VPQLRTGLAAAAAAAVLPGRPTTAHYASTLLPAISNRSQARSQGTGRSGKATAAPTATAASAVAAPYSPEQDELAGRKTPVALSMASRLRKLGLPPPPAWEKGQSSSTTTARDQGAARPCSGTKNPLVLELQQLLLASNAKAGSADSSGSSSEAATARRQVWQAAGTTGVVAAAGMPKALQPLMRRALKVVADPAAFLDGYVPAAAQRRRKVKSSKKLLTGKAAANAAGAVGGASSPGALGAAAGGEAGGTGGTGTSRHVASKAGSKSPAALAAKLVRAAKPKRGKPRAEASCGSSSMPDQLADRCGDMRVKQELRLIAVHDLIHQRVKRTVLEAKY